MESVRARSALAAIVSVALMCTAGAVGAGGDPATEVIVEVRSHRLDPASLEVPVGIWVTFVLMEASETGLVVAADDGSFRSPPLHRLRQYWRHRFTKRGEVRYGVVGAEETRGRIRIGVDRPGRE